MPQLRYTVGGRVFLVSIIGKGDDARLKVRHASGARQLPPLLLTGAQLGAALAGWAFAQQTLDIEAAKAAGVRQGTVGAAPRVDQADGAGAAVKERKALRDAIAEYDAASGCGCCRDDGRADAAWSKIRALLRVPDGEKL